MRALWLERKGNHRPVIGAASSRRQVFHGERGCMLYVCIDVELYCSLGEAVLLLVLAFMSWRWCGTRDLFRDDKVGMDGGRNYEFLKNLD